MTSGPLSGLFVVELAGLGPAPFCGMVMADLGARVVRVDRPAARSTWSPVDPSSDLHNRGKQSVAVNLKDPDGADVVLRLVASADALVEGFRPGVAERLGVGPGECLARNPALVYGRVTGWGQTGPWASMAGHDIDYIALSGVLHGVGPRENPMPPLNLVGDYGGGGMLVALGVLAAIVHARGTGVGQVVDAAMIDGSALLTASHHGMISAGLWDADHREANLLDGGAPFYATYETADGGHVAVGALEPQFYNALLHGLGLDSDQIPSREDRKSWPALRQLLAARFAEKTRDEWAEHFEGSDACVAPVLSMAEAPGHPHNKSRGTFIDADGTVAPAPAPRFSETPAAVSRGPVSPGADTDVVLADLGLSADQIGKLKGSGAVA